ncbi:uncharacterized protein si:ch211-76l23.4 [Engraulis encrasicolus]|uniref:uncharacterized protein si:ch211-76l23.4 n=1 Tax=Engraulis encrasicolus TaxID=184585 RepID=UPI002FD79935
MSLRVSVLLLAVAMVTVMAQRRRTSSSSSTRESATATSSNGEWNYRDGSEKVNMRNVANLTEVLDNWRFDILKEIKNQLLNDHQSLLPDYARIQPLSEALDDLYKEFNALKAHLGDLTEKFGPIETFIDELKADRAAGGSTPRAGSTQSDPAVAAAAPKPTRRRIVNKRPSGS